MYSHYDFILFLLDIAYKIKRYFWLTFATLSILGLILAIIINIKE
ncbi:unnamed protein product [marine sediment metagenome]|uniref:Uncharacterized protein n=1 Tax=marine sediment metagenome TaxID=412755 RepID=X0RZ77_9ZZZZ